jgi:tetratricopeptide (TPR) repeat protein
MGRLEEELPEARRVVELDPLSARYNANLGFVYYLMGRHDLAIAQNGRAIDLDPSMYMPHSFPALTYAHRRTLSA